MDRFDDDTIRAELRELRPRPRPQFTAELDERAAAGFPRRGSRATGVASLSRLVARRPAMPPHRRLVAVLAVALAVLVAATAVVAISHSGGSSPEIAENTKVIKVEGGGGGARENLAQGATTEGIQESLHGRQPLVKAQEQLGESCEIDTPGCNRHGEFDGDFFGGKGAKGAKAATALVPMAAGVPALPVAKAGETNLDSAFAARDVERSAYIVLGTKPGEVTGAAGKVYEAVHAADGIVLHSSVTSGKAGATGASFELLIPSRRLGGALADFSRIAEVRRRHDATDDITAPTVGAAEELADSNAAIEGLLKELADSETEAGRQTVETRLHEERRRHATIRASLERLHRRASMSQVSVRIVTDDGAGAAHGKSGAGDWGVGDAIHDAGQILTIAAGVVLIALAVLAPVALIALLLWLANRFRLRRLRERTLG